MEGAIGCFVWDIFGDSVFITTLNVPLSCKTGNGTTDTICFRGQDSFSPSMYSYLSLWTPSLQEAQIWVWFHYHFKIPLIFPITVEPLWSTDNVCCFYKYADKTLNLDWWLLETQIIKTNLIQIILNFYYLDRVIITCVITIRGNFA